MPRKIARRVTSHAPTRQHYTPAVILKAGDVIRTDDGTVHVIVTKSRIENGPRYRFTTEGGSTLEFGAAEGIGWVRGGGTG